MSAAIDGELGEAARSQFLLHIKECRPCRHEYELERMTKNIVRQSVAHAKVPASVAESIKLHIGKQQKTFPSIDEFIGSLRRHPSRIGMLALGGVGAVLLLMFIVSPSKSHHAHTQPRDANIIHQTYNNFDGVLEGNIIPQIATDDPASVTAFFKTKCRCGFNVPRLKDCKLVGGLHSGHNEEHTVQLIYERDKDLIYIYEAKLQDVADGFHLQLSPNILAELQQTGWYFESYQPDCSLAIWLVDSTICCAVADLNKDLLLASLK